MNASKILVVLALGTCVAMDIAAASSDRPHNIAVVSLLDNQLHKIQYTGFDSSYQEHDVTAWRIPEMSEATAVELLKQRAIAENVAVLHQPGARATVVVNGKAAFYGGFEPSLLTLARDQGFDAIVVIHPAVEENARYMVPGYGVFATGGLFGPPPACPYGSFAVNSYRVSDGHRLDIEFGYSSWRGSCGELKSVPWKKEVAEYSDTEWATIEAAVRKKINDGLALAIKDLDFN